MFWQTTRFRIDLTRPLVMGIVNVTPDSFSDGGRHESTRAALAHCEQLLKDGAQILDIGGESTRPGAPAVSLEDELALGELDLGEPAPGEGLLVEIDRHAVQFDRLQQRRFRPRPSPHALRGGFGCSTSSRRWAVC